MYKCLSAGSSRPSGHLGCCLFLPDIIQGWYYCVLISKPLFVNQKNTPVQYNRRHVDYDLWKEIKNDIRRHDNAVCCIAALQHHSFWFDPNSSCLSYSLRIETRNLELWVSKATCCITIPPCPSFALLICKSCWMKTSIKWLNVDVQVIDFTLKMHESCGVNMQLVHLNTPCRTVNDLNI